jgi:hypothetical protein
MYLVALSPRDNINSILLEVILMIEVLILGISTTFNTHQASGSARVSLILANDLRAL